MKWARRYRARLRAALRAGLGAWRYDHHLEGQETLRLWTTCSTELLDSGDPRVPHMVAESVRKIALASTRRRMGIAPS